MVHIVLFVYIILHVPCGEIQQDMFTNLDYPKLPPNTIHMQLKLNKAPYNIVKPKLTFLYELFI